MNYSKELVTSILPGDQAASIEEFEGGKNTYVSDGLVRSAVVGTKVYDFKNRIVKVDSKNSPTLPKIGDIVIGYIEMLFGSMFSIKILYINETKSQTGFSAIASARLSGVGSTGRGRDRGDRRSRVVFRVGDIIRGRVYSLLNSTIHITIDEKAFGVLYTLCFNCGSDTIRSNNIVKCIECGAFEERKLTDDYGKETFGSIHKPGYKVGDGKVK